MDGIKNKIALPEETKDNLFDSTIAKKLSLKSLPQTLEDAKKIANESEFIKSVLGGIL